MARFKNKTLKKLLQIIGIRETYSGNITNVIYTYYSCNLTFEQQERLEERKNAKNILQLVRDIYDDINIIEQSEQFKNVKKYLSRTDKKGAFNFTDQDLEYFFDKGEEISVAELIADRYPTEKPSERAAKVRYVTILLRVGNVRIYDENSERIPETPSGDFTAPTKPQCVALINETIGAEVGEKYDLKNMNEAQRASVAVLKNNLSSPRFLATINSFRDKKHRDVFLSSFIKATHDKPDLNEDESQMYINLCKEYGRELELREQESKLDDMLEASTFDDEGERGRFTMTYAKALETSKKSLEECLKRQTVLQDKLSGARKDRIKEMEVTKESLATIIEKVREEEFRQIMLRIARAKELDTASEMQNINDFEQIFAEVKGISRNEIINGL